MQFNLRRIHNSAEETESDQPSTIEIQLDDAQM